MYHPFTNSLTSLCWLRRKYNIIAKSSTIFLPHNVMEMHLPFTSPREHMRPSTQIFSNSIPKPSIQLLDFSTRSHESKFYQVDWLVTSNCWHADIPIHTYIYRMIILNIINPNNKTEKLNIPLWINIIKFKSH